jgi:hypothetical protein
MLNHLNALIADRRGNITVTAALALPIALSTVGIALSYSVANSTRTSMQVALDAAVLAGVASSDDPSDQIAMANRIFLADLSKSANDSTSGITATFSVDGSILYGQASGAVKSPFAGLIGNNDIPAGARAAATKQKTNLCVLGLNGLDNGAFDINGSKAQFIADCAVHANSNSSAGMTMEGQPTAKAKKFGVTGGHKGDYSPPPVDGSPKVADPYTSLPFPAVEDCGTAGKKDDNIKDSTTLWPGTYCGGIHIFGNGTKVTLKPGVYVMKDGPLWIDADSVVTGDQVVIAFQGKGSTLQVWGTSQFNVTSPTTGIYKNMQFLQDPADDSARGLWVSIGGNTNVQYDGVAYFPSQNFWVFGDAVVNANSPTLAVVADKIWTQGSAAVNITSKNTRNLSVSGAETTYGARLVK